MKRVDSLTFLLTLSFLILGILVCKDYNEMFSRNGIYPHYSDNIFSLIFFNYFFDQTLFRYTPFAIFPLSILFFLKPYSKIIASLFIFTLLIISQLNQTGYGTELPLIIFFFISRIVETKRLNSNSNLFVIGLTGIYFFSAILKLSHNEWTNGAMLEFILRSNVSWWTLNKSYTGLATILALLTYFLITLELLCPFAFFHPKIKKVINSLFCLMHIISLLILKFPHFSLFLLTIHLGVLGIIKEKIND